MGETYRTDAITWINGIKMASGFDVETFELPNSESRIARLWALLKKLFSLFFNRGPYYDIVLAERSTSYGFLALFQRAKLRVVAQQGATDLFPNTFLSKLIKGWIQKQVYRKSDLIHAWGQTMYQHMLSIGVDSHKIILGPKGIDLSVFIFESFHLKSLKPLNLVVTRSLEWYYRHDLILQAISKLVSIHPEIVLHIVGDGSKKQKLVDLSDRLGISDCVVFHGRINQAELAKLLMISRIYISAPNTEGYSSSLMEAMACGCIPVITDLPSNRENITHGVNGFLFENGNPNELNNCLEQILNFTGDLSFFSDKNRKTAENQFDVSKNMKHFWTLYTHKLTQLSSVAN